MARPLSIFVDSELPLPRFVQQMEALLQLSFQGFKTPAGDCYYEFRNDRIQAVLTQHAYENDRDVNFEDYRYEMSITALNQPTSPEDRQKHRDDFARRVFQRLKDSELYSLMLVDNLQIKVEEFHPKVTETR